MSQIALLLGYKRDMTITVEEAIKVLETMLAGIDKQPFTYDVEKTLAVAVTCEALRMAIEKLKEN